MTHHTCASLSLTFENFFKTSVSTLLKFWQIENDLMRLSVVNGLEAKTGMRSKTGPDE